MSNRVNILLLTHGDAGRGLVGSAEMIVGHEDDVEAVSLLPGMSTESLAAEATRVIEEGVMPTLILVDVFGGTPSNVAMMLSKTHDVRCVSGLNLGMLLEVLVMRGSADAPDLVSLQRIAQSAGAAACRSFTFDEELGGR